MYAVYHGPRGLRAIAERVHRLTSRLADCAAKSGFKIAHENFFDTLHVDLPSKTATQFLQRAAKAGINLRKLGQTMPLAFRSTKQQPKNDLADLCEIFGAQASDAHDKSKQISGFRNSQSRNPTFLTHPVFNTHHTETEMLRYLEEARVARSLAHDFDDSARLVHDETERDGGDVSDFVAGIRQAASVCAGRPNDRLSRNVRATREIGSPRSPDLRRFRCSRTPDRKANTPGCSRSASITPRAAKRTATFASFRHRRTEPIRPARSWRDSKSCRSPV